ncbi:MAG TPA: hypothetical protein VIY28_10135 [Pseudonocardiaceae bacterium]
MNYSQHDDRRAPDDAPPPVMHAIEAAEAIREATYRMQRLQLAPGAFEPLDARSLATVGGAFDDITRGLAQFAGQIAGVLPDSVDQDLTVSKQIRDGLIAFRIAVLDASVAAQALELSATEVRVASNDFPRQRRR